MLRVEAKLRPSLLLAWRAVQYWNLAFSRFCAAGMHEEKVSHLEPSVCSSVGTITAAPWSRDPCKHYLCNADVTSTVRGIPFCQAGFMLARPQGVKQRMLLCFVFAFILVRC